MATVNKQAVAAAFGRAASGYTQHPTGTVGGRIAVAQQPASRRRQARFSARALSPTISGWIALTESVNPSDTSPIPSRN